jgi:hypothetical protein
MRLMLAFTKYAVQLQQSIQSESQFLFFPHFQLIQAQAPDVGRSFKP